MYAMTGETPALRAVVADDHPLLRDAIASLLELSGLTVVGRSDSADDLLLKVRSYQPDIAIVDIRMPPNFSDEGLQAAIAIRENHPETAVLVLSQHVEPEHAARLVAKDATGIGYLLKDRVRDGDTFIDAVKRVAAGETAFDPQVIAALVAGKGHEARERLSERELQVLSLMAEGLSNAAIGKRVHLSPRAVERDISTIFTKLGLTTTDEHNRRVLAVLSFLGMLPRAQ
jgi:DNA-binding NarL/FixJ family response regulator